MKICSKLHNYDDNKKQCPICAKEWRLKNKDKIKQTMKIWEKNNPEKVKAKIKKWQQKNRDRINATDRARYKRDPSKKEKSKAAWYSRNPNYRNLYMRNKRKTDIQFRLAMSLRNRLYKALKHEYKAGSAVKDLGCSLEDFKKYMELKFQNNMTWNNYGQWHIDHIIPLSKFDLTNRVDFLKACHYTNLQPLWAKENITKRDKI